jgi:hypothetical protein
MVASLSHGLGQKGVSARRTIALIFRKSFIRRHEILLRYQDTFIFGRLPNCFLAKLSTPIVAIDNTVRIRRDAAPIHRREISAMVAARAGQRFRETDQGEYDVHSH